MLLLDFMLNICSITECFAKGSSALCGVSIERLMTVKEPVMVTILHVKANRGWH